MAADRARESERPDRLFEDPLAEVLAGSEGRSIMADMEAGLPENPTIPIRVRYFDDGLLTILAAGRITQVVSVGAGMDTRAFRLGLAPDAVFFELDRPELLALKDRRLAKAGARPTCARRAVCADLSGAWSDDLVSAGFKVAEPAVFLAEGLLGYLEEPEVHNLLDTLATLAAPDSVLLTDVAGPSPSYPELATWLARRERAGMSQRFATDDPEGLLASHGWQAEVIEYGEDGANFGRWPWSPVDRRDPNWPHNYLITAYLSGRPVAC